MRGGRDEHRETQPTAQLDENRHEHRPVPLLSAVSLGSEQRHLEDTLLRMHLHHGRSHWSLVAVEHHPARGGVLRAEADHVIIKGLEGTSHDAIGASPANVGAADLIAQLLLGFTHRVPTVGEGVKHRLLAGGARRTPHATARRPTAATSRLGDRACADRSCLGGHPEPVHIARFGHLDHARRTRERRAHAQPHEQVATRAGRQRQRHGQRQPQPQPQQH